MTRALRSEHYCRGVDLGRRLRSRVRDGVGAAHDQGAPHAGAAGRGDDAPEATYAAVLDGRHLWIGVDRPGFPALRDTTTGRIVAGGGPEQVATSDPADAPGHDPAVLALPPVPDGALEVVLLGPGAVDARPVLGRPTDDGRVPVASGDRHRWELRRGADGALRLQAEQVAVALLLQEVGTCPGAITLRCAAAEPLALLPATGEHRPHPLEIDDAGRSVLTPDDLVGVPAGRAAVVAAADHRPVRRRDDTLSQPRRGAPLPELVDPDGRLVVRLRWTGEGLLEAEVPGPGTDSADPGTGGAG